MHIKSAYPPLPPLPEVNVHQVLFGRPDQAEWPDFTIHIEERTGHRRTYKEMVTRVGLGVTALGANGLGLSADAGDIVGLLGDNSLDYIDIVLSLLGVTTPFALISTYSTRFELVHALKLTKVTRLFVDTKLLKNVLAAIEDPDVHLTADNVYILTGPPVKGRQSFARMIDTVRRKNVPLEPIRPATKDTLAYLVMSSGTSGLPKAVMITHGNIICAVYQAIVVRQVAEPFLAARKPIHPVTICPLPMFHTYGLHAYIMRVSLAPITYVILEKWNTARYLKAVVKYRATALTLVPSLVHALVNHPDTKKTDLSSVTFLAARMGSLLEKDSEVSQGYGLSEGTMSALTRPFDGMLGMGPPPANTTGILVPGQDARIVRDDGTDAAPDRGRRAVAARRQRRPGVLEQPEANAKTFVDGWLRTGRPDTLKVSGVQVSPKEIEDVLFAHPEKLISDVSVAGVSGGRTDDEKVPRAWIVLSRAGKNKGPAATIQALEEWHRESLSRYKWLRGGIEVVKEIPKTPTGKNMRRVLQDQYEQRRAKKVKAKL
ncbi:hypothetical protein C8F01DRAFT_1171893 [Mycena amicta]|nr:hypothetical protein C8F01DRAFT_1171893 [Mycena amicta]